MNYYTFCLFVFLAISINSAYSQTNSEIIKSINQILEQISDSKENTYLMFDSLKNTLIFKNFKNYNLEKSNRIIVTDIHSEGVIVEESNKKFSIKIITNCDKNLFINTTVRNGFKISNSTNKIKIGKYKKKHKDKLIAICNNIQKIIQNTKPKKNNEEEIPLPIIKQN